MSVTAESLGNVTHALPGGGEDRPGQVQMAEEVASAIESRGILLVEAGTGTGKSLAYLTPIVASDVRAVIATATIALQGQLIEHDLPQVAKGLERPVSVALLKGRRNYICQQRLSELQRAELSEQLELLRGTNPSAHLSTIADWADTTIDGDREELDPAPPPDVWSAVSVGADECPGATRCPSGAECFSERARQRAHEADVIVTNHHYYGLHLASDSALLPDHDVVVFDEAHQLVETLGATCGTELGGIRFRTLGRRVRGVLTDDDLPAALDRSAFDFDDQIRPTRGLKAEITPDLIAQMITGRDRADQVISALRKLDPSEGSDVAARIERTMVTATNLVNDIDAIIEADDTDVLWVDGSDTNPVMRRTPLDVGPVLNEQLWDTRAVVMTSATLADSIVGHLGLGSSTGVVRVGSPFDYEQLGLLYCAADLPNPRQTAYREAAQAEIATLAAAAGGRTLALFTSNSAMREAAEALADMLPGPILVQGDAPRDVLVGRLKTERGAVLLATMSFWQGVDIPGQALTLVTIDRLPFPRPDEPVSQARRERAGAAAFREVDLPRAQTLLAQAAGRLIRRGDDRGVVAVLDPRLATSKHYRWDLISVLPPFKRTKDRDEVIAFLSSLDEAALVDDQVVQ
ncbi:MAG: ATP-dependent DNA helicase [Actinomycetia bacterium]|nr:ATP-dependent DNA helicase [Actinomycetes bacterium]